ncbi:hypothetical protein V7149_16875 [Bacillus sp. JJ1503]|uniref:TcaA NTF2-like domain-containing protein n=1 Tax=Bacillus sp. JJ1503 TaxID=3122956 RepID=UPI002FFF80CC
MKKLFYYLTFALLMTLLVACSGSGEAEESVQISVGRTGGLLTGIGKVKVYIDDKVVMKVKNNKTETVELSLLPGTHKIQTKGQGDKSDVVEFEVVAGADNIFHFNTEISNIYGVKLKLLNHVETANLTEQVEEQAEETEYVEDEFIQNSEPIQGFEQPLQAENDVDNVSISEEDLQEIHNTVADYGYFLINAINNGDFSIVQPYLLPDSNLYWSQVDLVVNLYSKDIIEHLYTFDIVSVQKVSENIYEVESFEEIGIESGGTEEIKEYQWIYTVEQANGQFLLSDIRKAKN